MFTDRIPDVPDISGDWYLEVVALAGRTPVALQIFMKHFTELGLIGLAAAFLLLVARAWRGRPRTAALAPIGVAGVLTAYGLSEWAKTYLDADRPCRTFPDVRIIAAECPPAGDWSFPSNHATVSGALCAAILLLSWRWGLAALPVGALVAFSRVFVGVHYPHDVLAGFPFGAWVVGVLALLLVLPVTALIRRRRSDPPGTPAAPPAHDSVRPAGPGSR
ncbi:phosphatase PAP2 family protein [Catenuloplanes japonicus]|uniref:phosphatase PAP2 family protein n=1 Tax=Catenuloplanes japonicus TaxID=33876 RepID=UPI0018DC9D3D|nr:phosphatase PAP2 family protein [Catenuloplanes japonicus]